MRLPRFHHGMMLRGLPYTEERLTTTPSGGTPYGPTHIAGTDMQRPIDETEKALCIALGDRLARTAKRLSA
jgi:NAD(P)H dehydrogenase (quinone)